MVGGGSREDDWVDSMKNTYTNLWDEGMGINAS